MAKKMICLNCLKKWYPNEKGNCSYCGKERHQSIEIVLEAIEEIEKEND